MPPVVRLTLFCHSVSRQSYDEVVAALKEAADDPATVVTVTTGAGDFYSSGNDLSNFTSIQGDIKEIAKESGVLLKWVAVGIAPHVV